MRLQREYENSEDNYLRLERYSRIYKFEYIMKHTFYNNYAEIFGLKRPKILHNRPSQ